MCKIRQGSMHTWLLWRRADVGIAYPAWPLAVAHGAARPAATHGPARARKGGPPSETPWCGRRAGCVFTQPWPQAGSLPFHGSLAGRQVTRIGSTPSVSLGAASTAAIRRTSLAPFPGRQPPLSGTPRFDTHLLFTARRRRALRRRPWPLGLESLAPPRVGGGARASRPPRSRALRDPGSGVSETMKRRPG